VFLVCCVGFVCLLCCLLFYCGGRHVFGFVVGVVVGVGEWVLRFIVARLCSALGCVELVDGFICVVALCGFCILVFGGLVVLMSYVLVCFVL